MAQRRGEADLRLSTYRLGSPRPHGEGVLVGVVRHLPRGVKKERYRSEGWLDVWLPALAPSRELLREYKAGDVTRKRFFARYRREMRETDPRQTIALLAELAGRTPIAVGCHCEDEAACHRSELAELIRRAAR